MSRDLNKEDPALQRRGQGKGCEVAMSVPCWRNSKGRSEAEMEGDEVGKVGRGQITTFGAPVRTLGIFYSVVEASRGF